jgi:type I restriction enzyme, R subunit
MSIARKPDEVLIDLSKAVKVIVDSQAKFPDWNKRVDIKSALKVNLILDGFGYPPVERDEVYMKILNKEKTFRKTDNNDLTLNLNMIFSQ